MTALLRADALYECMDLVHACPVWILVAGSKEIFKVA
jgi:hypothetical protein